MAQAETAILAGGCFWCLEAVYLDLKGVSAVKSGYIGGDTDNPSYRAVCTGRTGHAEAVRVEFDPAVISYDDLLDVFFTIHDPTQLNRQGHDIGTQYRSAIFPQSDQQHKAAEQAISKARDLWDAPIVTKIEQAEPFWPAEAEHDDYFARNPNQAYCLGVVAPKVAKARSKYTQLMN